MSTKHAVRAFYAVVLATALAGSTAAAAGWLGVDWWIAVVPVATVELGGVVLMMHATERRQMGETALASRLLSAAVAAMAVAVNGLGHEHHGQAAFFAGMSALGYVVYLLISAAARRDALRHAGKLPPTAPAYGLPQWIRHPWLTRRARQLALAAPALGLYGSLDAARQAVRTERRQAALARVLHERITQAAGKDMAQIVVHTYDLDEVAKRLATGADYDGLTALLAADLTPAKLAGADTPADGDLAAIVDATAPTLDERIAAAVDARMATTVAAPQPATVAAAPPATRTPRRPARKAATTRQTTAERVAAAVAKKPAMTQAEVAKFLGLGERTVQRHWPRQSTPATGPVAAETRINGTSLVEVTQ